VDPLPEAPSRLYRVVTPQQPGPVNPTPAILASPKPVVCDVGDDASFNVLAIGKGSLNYQWLSNGIALPNFMAETMTLSNVQFAEVSSYAVTVSDSNGSDTTGAVYLALRPRIVTQPGGQTAQIGDRVVLSVAAEGIGPLSYRWRRNGHFIPGQTNSTLILDNVHPPDAGNYSVTVSHELPWRRINIGSSNAVVTVSP